MTYTIRPIQESDNNAVEHIIRSCLIEYGGNHAGTAWEDPNLDRFSLVYQGKGRRYFVAEAPRFGVVGGVGIAPLPERGWCELQKMYVLPEHRGTGASKLLLDAALSFAKEHYAYCYLETLPNMTAAIRFYEKNGFCRTERIAGNTGHFACDVRYVRELQK